MSNMLHLICAIGASGAALIAMAACSGSEAGSERPAPRSLAEELKVLARTTIFFGHQSVGDNIVDGLRDLSVLERVPLEIRKTETALGLARGTWGHGHISYNGAPEIKLESFLKTFDESAADPTGILAGGTNAAEPDIALMKFCYVDFHSTTDVQALFADYQATMEAIRSEHPNTTLVHVTVPLTARQSFFKTMAKRLMGRPSSEDMNEVRERFNELLRGTYEGREPVFDLAAIESIDEDGRRLLVGGDRSIPMLVPAYTDDGEHLNPEGRVRVARELVALLASVAREREHERELRRSADADLEAEAELERASQP